MGALQSACAYLAVVLPGLGHSCHLGGQQAITVGRAASRWVAALQTHASATTWASEPVGRQERKEKNK